MKPSSVAAASQDAVPKQVKDAAGSNSDSADSDESDADVSKHASDKEHEAPPSKDGSSLLDGPGPYSFYLWADALLDILEEEQEDTYFLVLKSNVDETYERVAHLPDDKQEDEVGELIERGWRVYIWDMELAPERDPDTHAKGVAHMKKRMEESFVQEDSMVVHESLKKPYDADIGWWYELVLQKDKPADSVPAMCIDLEYDRKKSQWWFTDFTVVPQGKSLSAMSCVAAWTSPHGCF